MTSPIAPPKTDMTTEALFSAAARFALSFERYHEVQSFGYSAD